MAFYSSASNKSIWRGVDYFENGRVKTSHKVSPGLFEGAVEGGDGAAYDVLIDLDHPKKSSCTCPFASGRRVVCKHMVALYFASVPGSLDAFHDDVRELEAQYELAEKKWREDELDRITKEVRSLSAKEAKDKLIDLLYQNSLDYRYRNDYW